MPELDEHCGDPGCLICYPRVTRTGRQITEAELDAFAFEVERGYDPAQSRVIGYN